MPRRVRGFTSNVSTRGSGSSSKYWRAGCNFVPRTFFLFVLGTRLEGWFHRSGVWIYPSNEQISPRSLGVSTKQILYKISSKFRTKWPNTEHVKWPEVMAEIQVMERQPAPYDSLGTQRWGEGAPWKFLGGGVLLGRWYPCPISGLVKLQFANSCSCPISDLPNDKPQFSKNDTLICLYIKLWCL